VRREIESAKNETKPIQMEAIADTLGMGETDQVSFQDEPSLPSI